MLSHMVDDIVDLETFGEVVTAIEVVNIVFVF